MIARKSMATYTGAYVTIILIIAGVAICYDNVEFQKTIIERPWTTLLYHNASYVTHPLETCLEHCVKDNESGIVDREDKLECMVRCILITCTRRYPKIKDEKKLMNCSEELKTQHLKKFYS
ncbi:hypothetical protein PIB30_074609 [Stylosanthes scabra]|uniref:Uncharacterized protein n=1 Tax=Stylosanthes scabra TaxID=79078 RepID=A0ABU6VRK6_9FABA|nr:hypothetical protein [Stylosanthes scabra]